MADLPKILIAITLNDTNTDPERWNMEVERELVLGTVRDALLDEYGEPCITSIELVP